MKTSIYTIALFVILTIMMGCHGKSETSHSHGGRPSGQTSTGSANIDKNYVKADEAYNNIEHFIDTFATLTGKPKDSVTRAFTMRSNDLAVILGYDTTSRSNSYHVRAYAGLKGHELKMYLVVADSVDWGNKKLGNDLLFKKDAAGKMIVSKKNEPTGTSLGNFYVLDLNAACPSMCDYSSPFAGAWK